MRIEWVLIVAYVAATVQAIYLRETGKAIYWVGAAILTYGILRMKG